MKFMLSTVFCGTTHYKYDLTVNYRTALPVATTVSAVKKHVFFLVNAIQELNSNPLELYIYIYTSEKNKIC